MSYRLSYRTRFGNRRRLVISCLVALTGWPQFACSRSQESEERAAPSPGPSPKGGGLTDAAAADAAQPSGAPEVSNAPRSDERAAERERMVHQQIEARGVTDAHVLAAMRAVPRHWFVPEDVREMAYADRPLPIGEGQTISQPYIVALMTEALKITPETKVLEIGTGSGYQAAVLAELTPQVYTIEIVQPLGKRAAEVFKERGYRTIQAQIGDGYRGWPEAAPFDAIIVTCAPERIPQPLIEQLSTGGRICIPVGREGGVQELVVATKQPDGTLRRHTLIPVMFVPMTGEARTPDQDRD